MNTLDQAAPPSPFPSSGSTGISPPCPPLFQVTEEPDGARAIDWSFSDGQWRAIESLKRFILALAVGQVGDWPAVAAG